MRTDKSISSGAIVPLCLVTGIMLLTSACGGTSTSASPGQKQLVIGYGGNVSLPILAEAEKAAIAEAHKLGVKLIIGNSDDAASQDSAMRSLLAQHPDAMAVDPWDPGAIGPRVLDANALNIPWVTWISRANEGKTVTYIAADDVVGADAVSEYIFQKMGGQGEVAYIQGDKANTAGQNREAGFRQALAKFPGVKLVAYGVGGWVADKSRDVTLNALTAHPNIAAVLTNYDGMSAGAYSAAQTSHKNVLVSGVDGECPMLQSIWNGGMTATFDQLWENISALSVDMAVAAARGKTDIPTRIVTPSFTVDKAVMQQAQSGTLSGDPVAVGYLKSQVTRAIAGCP